MTKEPKIEKNVPVPNNRLRSVSDNDAIWLKMKPGDSVFYENTKPNHDSESLQRAVLIRKRDFLKRHNLGWEMITRQVDKGVRIWRIK
jgi:hypothetical protein